MSNTSNPSPRKLLYFLTFVHTTIDSYATVLPHLLPLLLEKLASQAAARNSLAGILISVYSLFSSLGQVLFGWLADRIKTIHFLTFGVGLTAVCLSLLGMAHSLFLVLLLLAIGGAGVAAFHPQATAQAAALAKHNRGFGVSLFLTGGNIGRAAGPLGIMLFLYRYGLEWMAWFMIPGLLITLLIPRILKATHTESQEAIGAPVLPEQQKALWSAIFPHLRPLLVLYLIAVIRTITTLGLENFLSLYLYDQQYSNLARSGVIALFIFAGAVGIMIGGSLSDRINRYRLLLFSLLVAPPLLYFSLHRTGGLFLILLFFGNVVLSSSITVNIVLAQQLLPKNESIASSFMMGAAWGVGGLLNTPVGMLADRFGLANVLDGLVMLPLVAAFLMILLPEMRRITQKR
ncbi:MAG: MFS transporter [Candidatus Poribacteria bacterium]|nr:MFS transporter [Candidatus Poribacteria bacterium]